MSSIQHNDYFAYKRVLLAIESAPKASEIDTERKVVTATDLLLIGKTGAGKSATGNSILRRKSFKSSGNMFSQTINIQFEVSEFKGRVIKVVDCPGVGDTRINTQHAATFVMERIEYAIVANPRGYHAFILVCKYGGRFTEEDQDMVDFLKKIFGNDFVKRHCILVLTGGDNFRDDSEESGQSFQEWLNEQEGVFKDLIKECNNRVILFDNKTKDEAEKSEQIERLLKMVDGLSSQGHRYTDANFALARETRDRIIVEGHKPMIEEATVEETSLILLKIQDLQLLKDQELKIDLLEKLLIRAENLSYRISTRDLGTGALHDLSSTVKLIQRSVSDEIKLCIRIRVERQQIEEKTRRMYEDEMRQLKEEFENRVKEMQRVLDEHAKLYQAQESQWRKAKEKKSQKLKKMEKKFKQEQEEIERRFQRQQNEAERKFQEHLQEESIKQKKKHNDLEQKYRKLKEANDSSLLNSVVSAIKWPFRRIIQFFSKAQTALPSGTIA